MDPEKEDVFSDPEETSDRDQASEQDQEQDSEGQSEEEEEEEEEGDEDGRIFNAWMQRCRGERHKNSATEEEPEQEVTERRGSRTSLDPPPRMGRRASLPCPSTLSSMTLSRLHISTAAPVTAKVLLRRTSSRRLLPPPQEVPPPPCGERERRGSLVPLHAPPTIPERERAPDPEPNPEPEKSPYKLSVLEKRGHFRRRNVMSLSDADSVCLICHNELRHGTGGTRELPCSHTFHKECIEEYLWRKQQCPTCHVQVSLPQNLLWTSTLKVP